VSTRYPRGEVGYRRRWLDNFAALRGHLDLRRARALTTQNSFIRKCSKIFRGLDSDSLYTKPVTAHTKFQFLGLRSPGAIKEGNTLAVSPTRII
jgi:hypothetical protein